MNQNQNQNFQIILKSTLNQNIVISILSVAIRGQLPQILKAEFEGVILKEKIKNFKSNFKNIELILFQEFGYKIKHFNLSGFLLNYAIQFDHTQQSFKIKFTLAHPIMKLKLGQRFWNFSESTLLDAMIEMLEKSEVYNIPCELQLGSPFNPTQYPSIYNSQRTDALFLNQLIFQSQLFLVPSFSNILNTPNIKIYNLSSFLNNKISEFKFEPEWSAVKSSLFNNILSEVQNYLDIDSDITLNTLSNYSLKWVLGGLINQKLCVEQDLFLIQQNDEWAVFNQIKCLEINSLNKFNNLFNYFKLNINQYSDFQTHSFSTGILKGGQVMDKSGLHQAYLPNYFFDKDNIKSFDGEVLKYQNFKGCGSLDPTENNKTFNLTLLQSTATRNGGVHGLPAESTEIILMPECNQFGKIWISGTLANSKNPNWIVDKNAFKMGLKTIGGLEISHSQSIDQYRNMGESKYILSQNKSGEKFLKTGVSQGYRYQSNSFYIEQSQFGALFGIRQNYLNRIGNVYESKLNSKSQYYSECFKGENYQINHFDFNLKALIKTQINNKNIESDIYSKYVIYTYGFDFYKDFQKNNNPSIVPIKSKLPHNFKINQNHLKNYINDLNSNLIKQSFKPWNNGDKYLKLGFQNKHKTQAEKIDYLKGNRHLIYQNHYYCMAENHLIQKNIQSKNIDYKYLDRVNLKYSGLKGVFKFNHLILKGGERKEIVNNLNQNIIYYSQGYNHLNRFIQSEIKQIEQFNIQAESAQFSMPGGICAETIGF